MPRIYRIPRIYRNPKGALIAGDNTGLAGLLNCSPWLLRLGWILALIISLKLSIAAYLVMALLMPRQPAQSRGSRKFTRLQVLEEEYRAIKQRLNRGQSC
jgi:phage shock protein PspC (stress-responsive transcriptional regulator)